MHTLSPGDTIAVLAPASGPYPAEMMDRFREGLAHLRSRYTVTRSWEPGTERGYLSAADPDRAAALNGAIADPDVRAIFCVRGGYGCLRLLDALDLEAARSHPTLIVGYSDITALHLALYRHVGWAGLSGPVVTEWPQMFGDAHRPALDHLQDWLLGETPPLSPFNNTVLTPHTSGRGTGPLLGGNLSVLSRMVGSPHLPSMEGAVLFLEDVDEKPYAVDRMLAHLQLAGVLDDLAGAVLGTFSSGDLDPEKPTLTLDEIVADYFADRPYPVATGLCYGHHLPRVTVPIGLPARLQVTDDEALLDVTRSLAAHSPSSAAGDA